MNKMLTLWAILLFILPAYGQKKQPGAVQDTYSGSTTNNGARVPAELVLMHNTPHEDYGTFTFTEQYKGAVAKITGEWTVLRGDAKNRNATVVELDAPSFGVPHKSLYFLRRKDGVLQKLDSSLHEIKPIEGNLLRKQ